MYKLKSYPIFCDPGIDETVAIFGRHVGNRLLGCFPPSLPIQLHQIINMADEEEEPRCKVTYIDLPEGATEETNWIKRAGKCQVVYPNGGHTFEGNGC